MNQTQNSSFIYLLSLIQLTQLQCQLGKYQQIHNNKNNNVKKKKKNLQALVVQLQVQEILEVLLI